MRRVLPQAVLCVLLGIAGCTFAQDYRPTATRSTDSLAKKGDTDFQSGRYVEALDTYRQAQRGLPPGSVPGVRAALKYREGRTLYELSRFPEAIESYRSALQVQRKDNDAFSIGATLHALGDAQVAVGDAAVARGTYVEALTYRRAGRDTAGEMRTLINLAQLEAATGAYADAISHLDAAGAALSRGAQVSALDRARLANSIGTVRALLGEYDTALVTFQDAARMYMRMDGQETGLAESLRNEAFVYLERRQFERARETFAKSIEVLPASLVLDRAKGQNGLGYALVRLGRGAESLPVLNEAVQVLRNGPASIELSRALESLGSAQVQVKEWTSAQRHYLEGLEIARHWRSPDDEREVLFSIGKMHLAQGEAAAAILYLKLTVNVSQHLRSGAAALGRERRTALASRLSEPYELLSRLLAGQGRLAEAEQVLLALKEAEYSEFVRGPADGGPVDLTPEEKRLADEINALGNELAMTYGQLEAHRNGTTVLDSQAFTNLREKRASLENRLFAKVSEVSARLAPRTLDSPVAMDPRDTRLSALVNTLTRSTYGGPTVAVMFVPEERVTTVLVTDSSAPTALQLPVGSSTINPLIEGLRRAIRDKGDYRPTARELYRHLIAPVEAHFEVRSIKPKTLMLYLTGRLRYLPFAALVDESGAHLIEKYGLAVLTSVALGNAKADPILNWTVSAFGSTQPLPSEHLPALLAVKEELAGIVRTAEHPKGTLPGQEFVDGQFTRVAWQDMLDTQPGTGNARNSVIHVSTHFQSKPGDWNRSFLLLGTGERYEISELDKSLSTNLDDVELVTLSACSTELTDQADGTEFEGLGAVFQKKGAKAVIGTLWPVQDEGGAALMQAFYAARGEHRRLSKAAALQDAQVRLLRGEIKSRDPSVIDLSHPFYWAPFILMGNWL